jgi:beta-lactamase superfamily II metal-dependent hydrolase
VSRSTPPNSDELEISIIGPGRGECVVVHLGDNEWCIVDSCIPRGHREPVAVEYLSSFGNGALSRVRLIVATHWHDDHIRGLASMLRRAPGAHFACSAALDTDNFFTLVEAASSAIQGRSGVDEFASIFEFLVENAPSGKAKKLAAPMFAIENRKLLNLAGRSRPFPATVTALSPSDGTVRLAFTDIAQWLPKTGEAQRRITNRSPNHTSVVLWIEAGARRALLGADLEHNGHPGEGWMAVLACHQDPRAAALFKVPHHGSSNADCPDVWAKMLVENPVAVVTPFSSGNPLPKSSDLQRLGGRTKSLYCTAAGAGKPPSRDALVEKAVRRVATERRVIEGQPGHVRVRWPLSGKTANPSVELFNGAYHV